MDVTEVRDGEGHNHLQQPERLAARHARLARVDALHARR